LVLAAHLHATETGARRREGRTLGSGPVLFPTIQFAIFFPIVFVLSWLLRPYPTRWKVLMVIASYTFYGWWDWHYVFLLVGSTIAN
jgi:hypothetical protein